MCAALAGAGVVATLLDGCASIPMVKATVQNGKVNAEESLFGKSHYILIRPKNFTNDILVVKTIGPNSHDFYHSLLMQCTHQQQPLNVNGKIIHCPAHGSEFDLDGNVLKEPALAPLKTYNTSWQDGIITVDLNS